MKNNRPRRHIIIVTVAVVLLALLCAGGIYVYRVVFPPIVHIDHEQFPITGIDISAHNGTIDFARVAADSVKFVYIKASEGASFHDSAFETNYRGSTAAGMATGAYHFVRFDVNGTLQAMNLLGCLKGKTLQLPLAIDVEEHGNPETSTMSVVTRLQEMIDYIEEFGYPVIIYTNINGYHRFCKAYFENYPLWICRFAHPSDDIDWTIWQYSHWSEVDGISGETDLNVFCSKQDDFNQWLGSYTF